VKRDELVISVTDRGYKIRQELIWTRWDKLLKEAGIKDFRLYDLRHNFASQLVMRGVDIYTVSKLLGHSKVEMTKVYAHLSDDHLQLAVNAL
jgi:site-specific recombinase XerD